MSAKMTTERTGSHLYETGELVAASSTEVERFRNNLRMFRRGAERSASLSPIEPDVHEDSGHVEASLSEEIDITVYPAPSETEPLR